MPLPIRFPGSKKKEETSYSAVEIDANRSDTDVSNQSAAPPVPGWPIGPERISSAPIWIIGDLLLLLMPIAFIELAALAYKLDGKELSDYGRKVQEAILLGPTLFPLAFAALGGRSLKKIALWRAQEGTSLGFLEHVIGSQSLVATIGHAITLHSLNFLTLGLLALWALSPLGGQSALRLVHETNSTTVEQRPIFYANVDADSQFPKASNNVNMFNQVNAVVSTALMTSNTLEGSPVDTWNHPKIPRIEELERAEESNSTERQWYTPNRHANLSYASLNGVDVINLSQTGATNFTIPYEYMYVNCELSPHNNITSREYKGVVSTSPNSQTQMKYLNGLNNDLKLDTGIQFNKNSTVPPEILGTRGFFIYSRGTAVKPDALIYGSREIALNFFMFECSMKSIMVEANIICEGATCGVERLRRLDKPREKRYSRHLPYDVVHDGYTHKFLIRHLASIGGNTSLNTPNPVDTYLYGERPWSLDERGNTPVNDWTQYIKNPQGSMELSHRFTRFLNTFWDASRWPSVVSSIDPFARTSLNQTSGEPPVSMNMNRTEATVIRQVPIYRASTGWIACLLICSSALLLLGIASFFLSLRITVPDIFDYVSSFTRDNPYVNAPSGGSGLDGAERARLLRKLPVQLGDVDAGLDTGYITMRSVEGDGDCRQGRVRRDRMYR